jgi:hypothetical protein
MLTEWRWCYPQGYSQALGSIEAAMSRSGALNPLMDSPQLV